MTILDAFWAYTEVQDLVLGVIGLIFVCEVIYILIDRFME